MKLSVHVAKVLIVKEHMLPYAKSLDYSLAGRHKAVVDLLARTATAARCGAFNAIKEQVVHQAAYGDPQVFPRIDLKINNFHEGKTTLADVSIANPSANSYINAPWNKGSVTEVLNHFNNQK